MSTEKGLAFRKMESGLNFSLVGQKCPLEKVMHPLVPPKKFYNTYNI